MSTRIGNNYLYTMIRGVPMRTNRCHLVELLVILLGLIVFDLQQGVIESARASAPAAAGTLTARIYLPLISKASGFDTQATDTPAPSATFTSAATPPANTTTATYTRTPTNTPLPPTRLPPTATDTQLPPTATNRPTRTPTRTLTSTPTNTPTPSPTPGYAPLYPLKAVQIIAIWWTRTVCRS